MRQSYRDKQNRRARIAKEKENKFADKKSNVKKSRKDNNQRPRRDERSFKEQRIEREETVQVEKEYEDIVAGRNAVLELLKSDKDINKIFVERGEKHGSINEIIARARENNGQS